MPNPLPPGSGKRGHFTVPTQEQLTLWRHRATRPDTLDNGKYGVKKMLHDRKMMNGKV